MADDYETPADDVLLEKFCSCESGEAHWCIVHANTDSEIDPRVVVSLREKLLDQLREKHKRECACGAIYQVVGSLLSDTGLFETDQGELALDTLSWLSGSNSDEPKFESLLPWYSIEQRINEAKSLI